MILNIILIIILIIIFLLLCLTYILKSFGSSISGCYQKFDDKIDLLNSNLQVLPEYKDNNRVHYGYYNKDWLIKLCFSNACYDVDIDNFKISNVNYYFEFNDGPNDIVEKLTCENLFSTFEDKTYQFTFEANENFRSYHWKKSLLSDFHNIISIIKNNLYNDKNYYGSFQCCYNSDYVKGNLAIKNKYGAKIDETRNQIDQLTDIFKKSLNEVITKFYTNNIWNQYSIYFIYLINGKDLTDGYFTSLKYIEFYDVKTNTSKKYKDIFNSLVDVYNEFQNNEMKNNLNQYKYGNPKNTYSLLYDDYTKALTNEEIKDIFNETNKSKYPDGFVIFN